MRMLVSLALLGCAASLTPAPHLKVMSFMMFNPKVQKGWVNLGIGAFEGSHGYPNASYPGFSGSVNAFKQFGVPSLYYMQTEPHAADIFQPHVGLVDGHDRHHLGNVVLEHVLHAVL